MDLSACFQSDDRDAVLYPETFKDCALESIALPRTLRAIGDGAFMNCENLKSITLDADSALEEIGFMAFYGSGLETFTAPPSLKKIQSLAFCDCRSLKAFRLNDGVRKLGYLCLLWTGMRDLELPKRVKMTPEQLGADQKDPKVLRLPQGLVVVGEKWFQGFGIEKLILASSVRTLEYGAFDSCEQLREVVLEPNS